LTDLLLFGPLASYLVLAIAQMRFVIEREQAEASKVRLQLALDAARLGSWRSDPLRRVIFGDTRFKEILDVATDVTPIEEIEKRIHPDDADRFWAEREAWMDPVHPKPYTHEYRLGQRDGEVRWVEIHALAYFEGTGQRRRFVGGIGTVQDITERKERDEKEHLLMREVSHRAKNMLSVVNAIARQTATKSPEDFLDRFSERIEVLSANQDLLIRNDWRGVYVADLVHAQLGHFASLIGSHIIMHGPKLVLRPAAAQAIGLALHELAANAGKYGALSTDGGRVDVGWRSDRQTFTMSWTEREGPSVSPPKRRGFGITVMKEMAERSLDGKVDLNYAPSGATWRLTCPVANALGTGG
jgi:two-component sensor histidine kinase